jgi:broad specificity phosphatase PhoE
MSEIGLPGLLVLIRHGESLRNTMVEKGTPFITEEGKKLLTSLGALADHKIPLTDAGKAQAVSAGAGVKARFGVPDELVHSGFVRTESTTGGILTAYTPEERARISVRRDYRMRERNPGWLITATKAEAGGRYPWLQTYWDETGDYFAVPPGGESLAMATDRIRPFHDDLFAGPKGRKTFVVAHGNSIRCLRGLIEDLSWEQFEKMRWPPNCGVVAYRFDDRGVPELLCENEILSV